MTEIRKFVGGTIVTIIGLFLVIFFILNFSGPNILLLPGWVLFFIGLANILYLAYTTTTGHSVKNLQAGLIVAFVGVAIFLGIIWHPQYFFWVIPSIVLDIIGLVVIVRSLLATRQPVEVKES